MERIKLTLSFSLSMQSGSTDTTERTCDEIERRFHVPSETGIAIFRRCDGWSARYKRGDFRRLIIHHYRCTLSATCELAREGRISFALAGTWLMRTSFCAASFAENICLVRLSNGDRLSRSKWERRHRSGRFATSNKKKAKVAIRETAS